MTERRVYTLLYRWLRGLPGNSTCLPRIGLTYGYFFEVTWTIFDKIRSVSNRVQCVRSSFAWIDDTSRYDRIFFGSLSKNCRETVFVYVFFSFVFCLFCFLCFQFLRDTSDCIASPMRTPKGCCRTRISALVSCRFFVRAYAERTTITTGFKFKIITQLCLVLIANPTCKVAYCPNGF